MRNVTYYEHHTGKLQKPLLLAVVSDLHNEPYEDIFPLIADADALLVPGDITDRYRQETSVGIAFLTEAARRMPTFFSLGNHEAKQAEYKKLRRALNQTGAEILINRHVRFGEVIIGGWYDPEVVKEPERLSAMEREEGVKILLCHKPEMYMQRMRSRQFDLVVAGHAHGGQIRLFGRGLYAPGQGILPRYTKGVYDGRMIVSAGAGNPARMPRWWNPCEVLLIRID
ncbi:MAG: metallophosphoesterase [Clostridia bacterium]|nr:metallophosphoesterase [Clostridia bacterium]